MLLKKGVALIVLLLAGMSSVFAQNGGDYDYSREMIWGATKATNSGLIGGFMFKYSRETKDDHFQGLGIEIVNVKHPQEQKYYTSAGNSVILGKENYLYSIRLAYSREVTFFKKAPQQGVQINGIAALGPTIGLEAPYYVEVALGGGYTVKEPYNHNDRHQADNIVGTGNFLQGLGQSNIVPGLNARLALSFEFGTFKSNVVGVQVGFEADQFTRKIMLIPTTENYSFFPSAFATLFYGARK